MIKPVIMAGGFGTRLWPRSRAAYPKQFVSLYSNNSLFQDTIKRLDDFDMESPIIICNEDHRFFVAEQLRQIKCSASIVLEPESKNTAPAIALSALIELKEKDSLLLILPADHIIKDKKSFQKSIMSAIPIANSGKLVTFGILPKKPHTGYGYIKKGEPYQNGYKVDSFYEKPSEANAIEYLNSGSYLWNSGIFLFKASRYIDELQKLSPKIYDVCSRAVENISYDYDFTRIDSKVFKECISDSIDYAVMEKTEDSVVVNLEAEWNDVGSWSSLWDVADKDKNGNALKGDIKLFKTKNSIIHSDDKLVASIGINNLVIVSTRDVVLVADKNYSQDVKFIVNKIKDETRYEWEFHNEVHRPWGKFCSVDCGVGYQVKRITVKPGAKLSLQKHYHRSEHWVVVSGKAKVTNGEDTFILLKNESTYIPVETIHSLENPYDEPLEIIEVQSGDYLGEDDIVRYEDIYGRMSD